MYGRLCDTALSGVPISGCLGDQQAALVGQSCFRPGQAKATYGTGCFALYNAGPSPVFSAHGLITTVAYKLGPNKPVAYALEGSVAAAGSVLSWLKDKLGIVGDVKDVYNLSSTVTDTADVYLVPAFSGLYAPRWRPDARGVLCGLTGFATRAHICRAALEALAFQVREVLEAMRSDCKDLGLTTLRVDGGMSQSDDLVQMQADLLGLPVLRPSVAESTALGAAIAGKMKLDRAIVSYCTRTLSYSQYYHTWN